jgi:hypothetical protein
LAISLLRLTTSNFIIQLYACCRSPYVTSSLTKGWVCLLQLLLVLASAVIFRAEARGTHDHIFLYQIQDFLNLESQVPVFVSPRNRVARLYPQALGSLFVVSNLALKVKVKVTLQLTVSQSVSLGVEPHLWPMARC